MSKALHLICAKCGSMNIRLKQYINKNIDDECWFDENYISSTCNNCGEVENILQHNDYMEDVEKGFYNPMKS